MARSAVISMSNSMASMAISFSGVAGVGVGLDSLPGMGSSNLGASSVDSLLSSRTEHGQTMPSLPADLP
jgi:hypothetical protein